MKDYGNAIKTLRKREQMTQAELAESLNVSAQAVSKWENNLAQPDFDTILKLTEAFDITLDEFAKLATVKSADATHADDEEEEEEAREPAPMLIGVCSQCGRSIYAESELGEKTPKMLCKACYSAREKKKKEEAEAKRIAEAYKRKQNASYFKKSMIVPAIIIGIIMIIAMISAPADFLTWLIFFPLVYITTVQIRWDNNFLADVFDFTFGKTFAQPGLIIPLDIDGILWAIGVKIVMGILWLLLSILVTGLGLLFCLLISPIAFPFTLTKTLREMREGTLVD